ncbi:DegV family protein [Coriobacteriales bacterium OH1046]|nr:DegV family protein [Coriobacteriales bacterium OH1046]
MTELNQEGQGAYVRKPEDAYDLEGVTTPNHNFVPTEVVKAVRAFKAHRDVHIIVDSCADFAPKVADRLGVEIIGFPYVVDGVEHIDDIWQSTAYQDFYAKMRAGVRITTSAVTPGYYYEVFERAAKAGTPTLYLGFTGGLSSSINSAEQARDMIAEAYPDFEFYVIDNLCPSAAAELLTVEAVRLAGNGASAAELYEWAKEARYYIQGYFTLDSFDALAAGGRIPPAAAQLGGKLDIKPVLSYDLNGSLTLKGVCRGRKKALRALVSDFRENWCQDLSLPVAVMHADAKKDADWLEDHLRKEKGCEGLLIIRSVISPVLGAHVGPGMVAVAFWGGDRREKLSLADRIARKVRAQE